MSGSLGAVRSFLLSPLSASRTEFLTLFWRRQYLEGRGSLLRSRLLAISFGLSRLPLALLFWCIQLGASHRSSMTFLLRLCLLLLLFHAFGSLFLKL